MAEPEEISLLTETQRLALADPFEPFILVMTSGERYPIGKMDAVSVGQERRVTHVAPAGRTTAPPKTDQRNQHPAGDAMNNNYEQLWAHYRQKPFVPFVMVLKDGRRIAINRPLQFAFNESRVAVLDDDDRITRFTPSDIAEFEQLHTVS